MTTTTSSSSSKANWLKSEAYREWLNAKIRRSYGLRKAAQAKQAARVKAIRRSYAIKNASQKSRLTGLLSPGRATSPPGARSSAFPRRRPQLHARLAHAQFPARRRENGAHPQELPHCTRPCAPSWILGIALRLHVWRPLRHLGAIRALEAIPVQTSTVQR